MSKKRGQATIFMILAVIILVLGSFFFYSQRTSVKKAEPIAPEVVPVKNFIETCISNVAVQGIKILGLNGGYITFPEQIENDPRTYLQLGPINSIKNPYWWHDGIERVPSEEFIIRQIENYITSNLNTCVEDFGAFGNQFDIRKKGNLNVKITLNEHDVDIDINYPLELVSRLNQTTIKLENFKQTLPIRLKKIYEAAKDIMEAENRDFFLEFKTIDLITLDKDIPTTDIEATCQQKVWPIEKVENKLKKLLGVNIPYINIIGSDFNDGIFVPNPFGEDTYKNSYYNAHYKWQITDKNYENLKVSFDYDPRWPFQFYARPSKNGLLKSNAQKGQDILKFFCLHIWHFTYDVIYPVKVTILDSAPNSIPYQFSFPFKVSVDHNQPNRKSFAATLLEQVDLGQQEDFCNDLANEISIYTIANATDEIDVAHVNLTFTCGVFTCDIGETEWLSFGAAAGLTKRFPYCVNGILRGNKQGYEQAQMFIQTDIPGTHFMHLKPIREFTNYEVVKHDFDDPTYESPLEENEKAAITISSTKSSFEAFGIYPTGENFPINLLNDDHEYEITIYLSDDEDLIGGYQKTWKVSADQIADANKIIFHVLEKKGSKDDRFMFISGLSSYSNKIPEPELI
ncbi:hypothetical protein CMO93_02790 [Candidatus Woesearchaeota archaeon]|nr:hypothetical protein [Candidatus Woesearchaeota archaeon]